MGILGRILGSDNAIAKGIEVVAKGLDSLIYTAEEKATDQAKSKRQAQNMLIEWMAASQGQRLARRVIALSVTAVFLFLKLLAALLAVIAVWVKDPERLVQSSKIVAENADSMLGAFMLILGFYFAAPYLGEIIKPALARLTKKSAKS